MLCKFGAIGQNFWNGIENGIFYHSTNFYVIQIKGFLIYHLRKIGDFAWQNGLEDISCLPSWLPPYKFEEILQSLSGHNLIISKLSTTWIPSEVCIPGKAQPHSSWWGCAFPVKNIPIRWGYAFPVRMFIDVAHRHCISLPGMGMCLIRNGGVPHWECTSLPGMHILTGNAHPHREYTSLPGIHKVYTGWGWISDTGIDGPTFVPKSG